MTVSPGHLADLLTSDATLSAPLHREMLDRAASLVDPVGVAVDFGSGSGTGTVALAQHFPTARVLAADKSPELLDRARDRANRAGVGARVIATPVDDAGLAAAVTEPVDLVWASSVLHEVSDPDAVLGQLFSALRPGGLLAVVEMDIPPTYLPDPGLEQRLQSAALHHHGGHPHQVEWTAHLERAGFTVELVHRAGLDEPPSDPEAARLCAQIYTGGLARRAGDLLDETDRAALATLLADTGPQSLIERNDFVYRSRRTGWFARRPG